MNADFAYAVACASWRVGDVAGAAARLETFASAAAEDNRRRRRAGAPFVPPPAKIVTLGARLAKLRELRDRGVDAMDDGRPDVAARAFGEALATPLARRLWFRRFRDDDVGAARDGKNNKKKQTPYPNFARGDLLRRRAEALLEAVDQDVDVETIFRGDVSPDASDEEANSARGEGLGGDDVFSTGARLALRVAARDLRESLLIDPGDVEARRVRVRLRRSMGDTLGAFDDARAALEVRPDDEALNRTARELAAEATRGSRAPGYTNAAGDGRDHSVRRDHILPAAYRALGLKSRDADARSIRRAYRRAAATWHPDKWQTRSEAERLTAAEKFRRVADAYEALGDAKRRAAYDADPERFPM